MRANKNGVNKDQKDKVKRDGYNRGQHCVYCLTYHMIFVTHYRKPVINDEMSAAMKEFSNHMAEQFLSLIHILFAIDQIKFTSVETSIGESSHIASIFCFSAIAKIGRAHV